MKIANLRYLYSIIILGVTLVCLPFSVTAQNLSWQSIRTRVDIQSDTAATSDIVDGRWVAVGIRKPYAICIDSVYRFQGKPSFRFELKASDNTLSGYAAGETKGRAELSACFATAADYRDLPARVYQLAQCTKTVYHRGRGIIPQGSTAQYTFSIYLPSTTDSCVSSIFAQWHGMPRRTLVQNPEGVVKQLSDEEFEALSKEMIFRKDTGYERRLVVNHRGDTVVKAGRPNGWKVEQGGYPPLAFGFSSGWFYIKANSDRRWMSDKTDRCQARVTTARILEPVCSVYKASTIAYKQSFATFPKDCWVTFQVRAAWSVYGGENEACLKPGVLDVWMSYWQEGQEVKRHIVDEASLLMGRNDDAGYYFKFGIYRVGNSTVPVTYNLAGYDMQLLLDSELRKKIDTNKME